MNKSTFIEKFARGETARNHNAECENRRLWLHGHEIVKADGDVISLDPCGWYTQTTKSYMNLALQSLNSPYRVVQKAGDWYVQHLTTKRLDSFKQPQTLQFD